MKQKSKLFLSRMLLLVLIAATALTFAYCDKPEPTEGIKTFTFEVYGEDGGLVLTKEITTDALYVGEALVAEKLIEGDREEFGLYVKKVNGIFAEFETTGTYWAFYIGGEYASAGVDITPIVDGEIYAMKVEK